MAVASEALSVASRIVCSIQRNNANRSSFLCGSNESFTRRHSRDGVPSISFHVRGQRDDDAMGNQSPIKCSGIVHRVRYLQCDAVADAPARKLGYLISNL